MQMAGINLSVAMPRRRVTINIGKGRAEALGVNEGANSCYVLGLFQCTEAITTQIRFVEEDEEGA